MKKAVNEDGIEEIHLEPEDSEPGGKIEELEGCYLDEDDWVDLLVEDDTDIYKPNGEPLLKFREGVFSDEDCKAAYEGLRRAAISSENRGAAAGPLEMNELTDHVKDNMIEKTNNRVKYITENGNVQSSSKRVLSGIAGYYDRSARHPYCRTTRYTRRHMDMFEKALPFIQDVSNWFQKLIPERWKIQNQAVDQTAEDFVIPGTVFTTITVNKNFRTGLHQDAGDLEEGFGNLTVLEEGDYDGGYTIFPQFKIGVDCREGDFLGMDVHEWHCNTEFYNQTDDWERISLVCYYRTGMSSCKSKEMEERRKKKLEEDDQDDQDFLDELGVLKED
jgi:hypothetical protein